MMRSASEINEQTVWQELTPGGEIYEGGTARLTRTGDWRTDTPVFHAEACRHCMLCVPFCPDSALLVQNGHNMGIDLMHCKGCGICARVCPFGAISMREGAE